MRNRTLLNSAIAAVAVLALAVPGFHRIRPAIAGDGGELPRGDNNGGWVSHAGTLELTLKGLTGRVRQIGLDEEVVVPGNVEANLRFVVPVALDGRVTVEWTGVSESAGRDATIRLPESGTYKVDVVIHVASRNGLADGIVQHRSFTLRALDVSPENVKVRITYPNGEATPPVDLNGDFHIDGADLDIFWASYGESRGKDAYRPLSDWDGSATVDLGDLVRYVDAYRDVKGRDVGATYGNGLVMPVTSRPRPDETAFATPAPLVSAVTEPEGLESWIEWTLDGTRESNGRVFSKPVVVPGRHEVGAGLFGFSPQEKRSFTAYSVSIRDVDRDKVLQSDLDIFGNSVAYHLEARTDPPGFEHLVNWYASTLHGSVSANRSRGARFTVRFDGTFGPEGNEWLGVQADNAYLNQDQKVAVTIGDVSRHAMPAGQVFQIFGGGFDPVADNGCVHLNWAGNLLNCEVISAEENCMTVRLVNALPPGAIGQTAQVMVGRGAGERIPFVFQPGVDPPNLENVVAARPFWTWRDIGLPGAAGPNVTLTGQSATTPALTFHSGPPMGGVICVDLTGDWGAGAMVCIYSRVHKAGTGADTNFENVTNLGGTLVDCAAAIASIIEKLYREHANPLPVECDPTIIDAGTIKLTLSLPGMTIDGGDLTITVKPPVVCDCPDTPELANWNNAADQPNNNCYNYSTNQKTGTFAQPGRANGITLIRANLTCATVTAAAIADGAMQMPAQPPGMFPTCPADKCLIALVMAPSNDYHWYRRNDDGSWSHKPGGTAATTLDNAGAAIVDPRTANRGPYNQFCDFFCVPWNITVKAPQGELQPRSTGAPGFVRVDILARSGVPDPGWILTTQAEVDTINGFLQSLPSTSNPNWPSLLGYRGFSLRAQTDQVAFHQRVRVWNGVIGITNGGTTSYFVDSSGLENYLETQAIQRGLGGELPP